MVSSLRFSQRCALLGCAMGLVTLSHAQGPRERPRYVLTALDTDHDGTLSAAEITAAPASLRALDRNGDGELAPDELEPPRTDAGANPDQLVTQLMSFDKNGDGVLTTDEMPDRMHALFVRGDANHDGKLTPDEIRAMAAHTGGPNGRVGGSGSASGAMRADPILNALDTDHNGILSAGEISAASANLLTLDKDSDGAIEPQEMKVRQQTPADRAAHMLDEWDTNKDGKLSSEEVPDGMKPRFAAADTNGDGFLDKDELVQMFAQPQPGRGGNGPSGNTPPSNEPKGYN